MSETSRPVGGNGATGATVPANGPYRSARNARVIIFMKKGSKFPADTDGASTTWTLSGA